MSALPRAPATPPAGRGRHWSTLGEETFVGGVWLMYALFRIGGRVPFRAVLYPVVLWYWLTNRPARAASLEYLANLQRATGAIGRVPGARETLRHFLSFAETILDKLLAVGGRYRFGGLRLVGHRLVEDMVHAGRGGLLVTAHVGCLELCQASAALVPGLKLTVLVHTTHAVRFNRVLERLSPGRGLSLLQVTDITPATAVLLAERIERGEFVAIAGDRVPVVAGRASAVEVPFLGRPAPFPTGAYLLASLLKCPVLTLVCIRQGESHEIVFEPLADRIVLPRADRTGACVVHATAFAQRLERLLARAPYEWFNFHAFWDQPAARSAAPSRPTRLPTNEPPDEQVR